MKNFLALLLVLFVLMGCTQTAEQVECPECEACEPAGDPALPEPRACGVADDYSTDCSSIKIADNLQDYLGRDDVVYIDLRDYADYGKAHIRNFESVPYFALIRGMGEETEAGVQLYYGNLEEPTARYAESEEILKALIPTDKVVFLMCQSGGRVAQCMKVLEKAGYDMSKIYNVGGMAQLEGNKNLNAVQTAEIAVEATYNFEGLTQN